MKRLAYNLQILVVGSVVSMLFGLMISGSYGHQIQLAAAQNLNKASDAVQFSVKGTLGSYTWVNANTGASNPTLSFKTNTDQIIKIQNPTDTKHQLIIDQNGKQLATSGDVAPGSSGQVSFKPITAGTYGYHCLYHPTMMKGVIQVH
ncbi:cupredoxin domain-containing protein [Nitrososphaera sp. AFS]|uniref:cupredoxin domain-containing protein n=1 Tax=Nitrososphaera sp. AFS TaxID=2301191 RepID=UPI00139223A2|nr:cupredoxin domain-containing protein [Nitrososphaera sp. AFS]NAL78167.1 hypothetical protein [Nitrososphaera sp. AFS]